MLMIICPVCGAAGAETEFHPGGQAHLRRAGPGTSDEDFAAYLFERANPRGVHLERWRHQYGCGRWFNMARCTVTLRVLGAYDATAPAPPAEVAARIAAHQAC
ncbi:MAG: sarcosine oxidase subunit delta [Rubrimonas sp.]